MGVYATLKDWSSEKNCKIFDQMTKGIIKMRGYNVYNCDDQYLKITDVKELERRVEHYKVLVQTIKDNPDEYIFYG